MKRINHEEIAGAVARGWCHPDNETKTMDEKLAWAIVSEVEDALMSRDLRADSEAPT